MLTFYWYLESSKIINDRNVLISLQETNKKLLEAISGLKRPQTLMTPSSALLLYALIYLSSLVQVFLPLQPPAAPLPPEGE